METLVIEVNVGNTTTKFGLAQSGRLLATLDTTTILSQTSDEAFMSLGSFLVSTGTATADLLRANPVAPAWLANEFPGASSDNGSEAANTSQTPDESPRTDAILASVVPSLTDVWAQALKRMCTGRALLVGPGLKTGLKIAYNDPGELGADRVAYMAGAKKAYGAPALVVNLDTTTNVDLLDERGQFAGGIIAPGMRSAAMALSRQAARLPVVECKPPATVVGKRTRDAMQSGIVLGEAARIDGLIDLVWNEVGYQTQVIVTGMDAKTIAPLMRHEVALDEHLGLQGLLALHALNVKHR